tara:strand:- start:11 stop:757 length:747 start_codon:yes stop_codon:yes gene_type:complete
MKTKAKFVDKHYRLIKETAPLTFMVPSRNTRRYPLLWFDEEKGQNRPLRYAVNQKSPFEDEQDGNAIVEPIIFEDGFLMVPRNNQVLQEFLEHHPMYGKKFKEVDEEKTASEDVEFLNLEVDALVEARQLSLEQLESIASVIFGTDVSNTSTAEIKRDVLIYARQYPEDFLDIVSDPMIKLQADVKKFFDASLLTFRKNQQEVWFNTPNNKKRMLVIPFGEDAFFVVANFLRSDDGIETLKILEKLLD